MRPALTLSLLVAVLPACEPTLDARSSLVAGTRVLAIRSTPAEAAPGTTVTYDALIAGSPAVVDWALCNDEKPLTEQGPVSSTCVVPTSDVLVDLGKGVSASGVVPKDACRVFGPDLPLPKPGESAGRPTDPDVTGGYYQPVRVAFGDPTNLDFATGETRLSCGLAAATEEQVTQYQMQYRANENPSPPAIAVVTAAGATPVDPSSPLALEAGQRATLRATWQDADAETYVLFDTNSRAVVPRREAMRVSWFATGGTWDEDGTGRGGDDPATTSDNGFVAPASRGAGTMWIVLRDERGGVSWVEVSLAIQ